MGFRFQIAQLRHAFSQLVEGHVGSHKKFAEGLIAPAIETFEQVHMGTIGLFTGLTDMNGYPIYLGDTLSFDEKEFGEPCEFVITFENGQLIHPGSIEDLSEHCAVIKKDHRL